MPQFLLLIYEQENRWTSMNEAATHAEVREYYAFGKEFASAIKGGNALQPAPTAKTVRVRGGKSIVYWN